MSKRKRLKGSNKKNRTGKIQSVPGMVNADYVSVYGPFKDLSKEQISEVVNKLGDHNKLEFSKVLNELQEHIRPFDLLSMISYFSYYFLTTPPGINTEWERRDFVKQHDIEILQALKLQETLEDNKEWRPLLPENAEAINNLLKRLSSSYSLQRFQYKDNQQEQKQLGIIERIRENTMVIRNWGYAKQIIRIVEDIYRPIDDAIERETGLSIIKLLHMCVSINNIIEDRMNEHLKKTRSILQTKSVADLVDAYLNNYPFVKSSREDLLKLREEFRSFRDFKYCLISHSDLLLSDYYSLTLNDFISVYGEIKPSVLRGLLDNWSISHGDLKDYPTEHIFLSNPVWEKPLIKIGDQKYAWPIVGLFLHSCVPLMESVFITNTELKEKYEKRRGKFLEEDIARLFQASFQDAHIFKNLTWKSDLENKKYENDLLVIIDSFAIVVEAKGGKITAPARRGAPDRLKREIQDLIVDPSKQAQRFARFLEQNLTKILLKNENDEDVEVDLSNVTRVTTLSVTLELFGDIQAHIKELREAGLIKDTEFSPCITLSDLEIVFDLLETSCEKIHYLTRRSEFEQNADYLADEMDLLVFYLQTGFNIGEDEFNGQPLMLYGTSQVLEAYYMIKYDLHDLSTIASAEKPRPRRTKWWQDIIFKLDSRKIQKWTEMAYTLLNVSYEDQRKFEKGARQVMGETDINWKKEGHLNSIILSNGPPQRKEILIYNAYKKIDKETRNNRIKNVAIETMDKEGLKKALVIGVELPYVDYPDSILALLSTAP